MKIMRLARAGLVLIAASLCLPAQAAAAGEPRTTMDLASGWRFKQADGLVGVEARAFNDSTWPSVAVPHTWNRIGNAGTVRAPQSNSVQGVGWYRLRFTAPASARGRRSFLQFDGVGSVADVWLNGRYLGKHEGAFSGSGSMRPMRSVRPGSTCWS